MTVRGWKVDFGRETVVSYSNMFLHTVRALDWDYAGMLCFRQFIDDFGTEEEKIRLEKMKVGYRRDWSREPLNDD